MKKPLLLFILKTPPPVSGGPIMNEMVATINKRNTNSYLSIHLEQSISKTIRNRKKFHITKILKIVANYFILLRTLLVNRVSLVYLSFSIDGLAFYKDLITIFIVRLFSIRMIYHVHVYGTEVFAKRSKMNSFFMNYVLSGSYVIVVSESMVPEFDRWSSMLSKPPFVLLNGLPEVALPKKSNHVDKQRTKLLFLSTLTVAKGLNDLLEAMTYLDDQDVELTVVGPEDDVLVNPMLYDAEKRGIGSNVRYGGVAVGDEKYDWYCQSDLFVFPSHMETFGLVLIEAMQAGLPIITTNVGGIPSVITHNETGWLVPPNDPQALAEAIRYLYDHPLERKRLGENARQDFKNRFTIETFESNFLKTIDTITQETLIK